MIIISKKAQEILQWYKDTFVDYKTPQEYGRSAFWLWYNQVSNEIRNLDYRTILHNPPHTRSVSGGASRHQ